MQISLSGSYFQFSAFRLQKCFIALMVLFEDVHVGS